MSFGDILPGRLSAQEQRDDALSTPPPLPPPGGDRLLSRKVSIVPQKWPAKAGVLKRSNSLTPSLLAGSMAALTAADRSHGLVPEPFGPAADWFALGVILYELTEHQLPFGSSPAYVNSDVEYRNPRLLDDTGLPDGDLNSMLLWLLEWLPAKRLGHGPDGWQRVKSHKYWSAPDWTSIDLKKVPSPLKPLARAKVVSADAVQVAQAKRKDSLRRKDSLAAKKLVVRERRNSLAAVEQAVELGKALAYQKEDEKRGPRPEEEEKKGRRRQQAELDKATHEAADKLAKTLDTKARQERIGMLHVVADWNFVSPHVVEDEYLLMQASFVSIA